ncbi:MAG: restriction endonuclease subunit S [Lentihominibacter sp.]|jgi:type I restriction enzyme S subunit
MIFDDVLEIKNGRNQKAVENPNGKYPIYGSGGIMGYADDYICDADTVVIGRKGNINNPIYVDEPFWNVDTAFGLQAKKSVLSPRYLYYFCKNYDFERLNKTVTIPSLTKHDLLNIKIDLPNLDEQQSVVGQLYRIERIIGFRNNELEKLDYLIKARFVELFGDPEINPKRWEQVTLDDVCSSIIRGPFGSALKKEFFVEPSGTTYKVYEQKHAIQKSAEIGTYYVTEGKFQELKRFECVAGDILMSCSGTMGELYQLPKGCEKGIINQALCKFTLNERILPICFLTYMKETIGNLETKGSGIKNIAAVSYVKQMPINLPPMSVQEEFDAFCKKVDKSKAAVQESLDKAQLLFDSLMQKYFG